MTTPEPTVTTPPKFLYVEDDALSREVLKLLITRVMGYPQLTLFDTSENFMDRLRAAPYVPDVIFLDIQMRHHSGYDLLRMLKEDPVYKDAKVIAMTANVMASDVEQLRKVGFNGLIGKPILKDVFPDLLKRILNNETVWFVP